MPVFSGQSDSKGELHVESLNPAARFDLEVDPPRSRDDLARLSGLTLGARGGIEIDETCRTSDPEVFAIGECALFAGKTYGLKEPKADITLEATIPARTEFMLLINGGKLKTNVKVKVVGK